ncbi:MAG: hypothetical protein ACI4SF_16205 [Oscillospiraceae bacterium]
MEAKIGMIVRSAAGHDKGNFLVITAVEGDFAFVADGKERKLQKPKKKRLKHLKLTNTVIDTDNLTDKGLRKIISAFPETQDP